ncbi:thioredoxin family protein [Methanoregula sp. UBA64]|jgi:thiol-disulfide isomerase/thioredoxin|uniref:thioredoxin family protein n=1 Tax=Methanoregula sp. UBA64 TaxID=1915554 RepID=UPI0025CF5E6A|nr:thioredoxin family protein [Methanoregula sp. UBA64]
MDRIIKSIIAVFAIIAVLAVVFVLAPGIAGTTAASPAPAFVVDNTAVYFFYGEECPHCKNVEPFIDNLSAKYPDVTINRLEIWHNQTNKQIYDALNAAAGISSSPGVPEVIVGKVVLVGERDIPAQLEPLVQAIEKKKLNPAP